MGPSFQEALTLGPRCRLAPKAGAPTLSSPTASLGVNVRGRGRTALSLLQGRWTDGHTCPLPSTPWSGQGLCRWRSDQGGGRPRRVPEGPERTCSVKRQGRGGARSSSEGTGARPRAGSALQKSGRPRHATRRAQAPAGTEKVLKGANVQNRKKRSLSKIAATIIEVFSRQTGSAQTDLPLLLDFTTASRAEEGTPAASLK